MAANVDIAGPPDLDDLIEVACTTYRETYDPIGEKPEGITKIYADQTFVPEKLLPSLESGGAGPIIYFVARCDGIVAGYASLTKTDVPAFLPNQSSINFSGLYVLKAFAGRGIGRTLFERRMRHAIRLGYSGAWLSVWTLNKPAIGFHERMGFKPAGRLEWRFEAQGKQWICDDLVMYREICDSTG